MAETQKEVLVRYLQAAREALLWKLDGLSEYDVRRPITPTGTNLLGLVKHVASVELGYFVACFGRELPVPLPWHEDDAEDNADMWATPDESREDIVGLYHLSWEASQRTFDELGLESEGAVPWWPPERRTVTLQQLLVHMIAETNRHAGHADIVRETIDGAAGLRAGVSNLPDDGFDWPAYVERLEGAARTFRTTDHLGVVRGDLIAEHDPVVDSIVVVRDEVRGDEAAVAVTFERKDGVRRQGMLGATRRDDGVWHSSGGFMSTPQEPDADAVFVSRGGWGNERREVYGGWVADPAGVSVRLVDDRSDEVLLEDRVRDGVVIFIGDGGLPMRYARADLLDEAGHVLRSQQLLGSHR